MSSKKSLRDFLHKRKEDFTREQKQIDWDKKIKEWIDSVNSLYNKIESWLSDLKVDGTVEIDQNDVNLSEQGVNYSIKSMQITVGTETVFLNPKGTFLVGARGRIDMTGRNGTVHFILPVSYDENDNVIDEIPEWHIGIRTPKLQLIRLDEEAFSEYLEGIMSH